MESHFTLDHLLPPETLAQQLASVTYQAVERSLGKRRLEADDLVALLSPAAENYLEPMAQRAQHITYQRFGKVVKLYAPLYLSNECVNACVYCGFNRERVMVRRTLSLDEVTAQADYLSQQGFQAILLVSGESPQHVSVAYLANCLQRLHSRFPEIAIEVYPLATADYQHLAAQGLYSLVIYQETYLPTIYQTMHPAGRKADFYYRLQTPERGAQSGLRQIGLGVLLGLADFRLEGYYLALHARYLTQRYWQTLIGLSFPRVQVEEVGFHPPYPVSDAQLVQLVTALRLFLPEAPFSLSTRESANRRRHLLPLGFTQMSAGSCTTPGGYGQETNTGQQFPVQDLRSVKEVADDIRAMGWEPVWKDWDKGFRSETISSI